MTGTPQFIKPYPDIRAGESQRTFLLARHGTTFTINGFKFRRVSRRNPLEFSRTTDRGVPWKFISGGKRYEAVGIHHAHRPHRSHVAARGAGAE
jgi:hypothetical protein